MKKMVFVLCFSLLMLSSVALADQTLKTDHFEITFSDAWTKEDTYCHNGTAIMSMTEVAMNGYSASDMEDKSLALAEAAMQAFFVKSENYDGSYEIIPVKIDGKNSAIIAYAVKQYGFRFTQYAALCWADNWMGIAIYGDLGALQPFEDFIQILTTFKPTGISTAANADDNPTERYINIGTAEAEFTRYEIVENKGKSYIVVYFRWKNFSDEADTFMTSFDVEAYQNAVELDSGWLLNVKSNKAVKLLKDGEIEVAEIYELRNTSGDVEIHILKHLDLRNVYGKVTFTLPVVK